MNYETLKAMTESELLDLNRMVVDMIKFKRNVKSAAAVRSLTAGDKVEFFCNRLNSKLSGIVIKVKPKNVLVNCGDSGRWNVSGNNLVKV
jgi:hypothetical protein